MRKKLIFLVVALLMAVLVIAFLINKDSDISQNNYVEELERNRAEEANNEESTKTDVQKYDNDLGATSQNTANQNSKDAYKKYNSSKQKISFEYPSEWQGPEVYEYDYGLRAEIGTDKVYPYGTDPTQRTYTKENNYYVVVQLDRAQPDTNPNIEQFKELQSLPSGQSLETTRNLTTKVRNFETNDYKGVEFISTLSATAQTERFYVREAILINENNDVVTVMGSPDNVGVAENGDWRLTYKAMDVTYLSDFEHIVDSIDF